VGSPLGPQVPKCAAWTPLKRTLEVCCADCCHGVHGMALDVQRCPRTYLMIMDLHSSTDTTQLTGASACYIPHLPPPRPDPLDLGRQQAQHLILVQHLTSRRQAGLLQAAVVQQQLAAPSAVKSLIRRALLNLLTELQAGRWGQSSSTVVHTRQHTQLMAVNHQHLINAVCCMLRIGRLCHRHTCCALSTSVDECSQIAAADVV